MSRFLRLRALGLIRPLTTDSCGHLGLYCRYNLLQLLQRTGSSWTKTQNVLGVETGCLRVGVFTVSKIPATPSHIRTDHELYHSCIINPSLYDINVRSLLRGWVSSEGWSRNARQAFIRRGFGPCDSGPIRRDGSCVRHPSRF